MIFQLYKVTIQGALFHIWGKSRRISIYSAREKQIHSIRWPSVFLIRLWIPIERSISRSIVTVPVIKEDLLITPRSGRPKDTRTPRRAWFTSTYWLYNLTKYLHFLSSTSYTGGGQDKCFPPPRETISLLDRTCEAVLVVVVSMVIFTWKDKREREGNQINLSFNVHVI